jgi:hypothetical protein
LGFEDAERSGREIEVKEKTFILWVSNNGGMGWTYYETGTEERMLESIKLLSSSAKYMITGPQYTVGLKEVGK